MKERPILFSGPMVRAILDGRKTQTRRIVKPRTMALFDVAIHLGECSDFLSEGSASSGDAKYLAGLCPFGQPGDKLWVKETYSITDLSISDLPGYVYRATDPDWSTLQGFRWKPSIFCTRAASRMTLEITGVRVERLNDISEEDAIAEGVTITDSIVRDDSVHASRAWVESYRQLWEQINGAGSWEVNPWVWVIEFKADRLREGAK